MNSNKKQKYNAWLIDKTLNIRVEYLERKLIMKQQMKEEEQKMEQYM